MSFEVEVVFEVGVEVEVVAVAFGDSDDARQFHHRGDWLKIDQQGKCHMEQLSILNDYW